MEEIMPADDGVPPDVGEDHDEDSCVCGLEHVDDEVTADEELPSAAGGIAQAVTEEAQENEDDVDGCEIDFLVAEQTDDEELPPAAGGI
jgi:hypothetical protein